MVAANIGGNAFQTRTGHLSHSNGKAARVAAYSIDASNPDGPPLPFQREVLMDDNVIRSCFKPGRATSPIPTTSGTNTHEYYCKFQTRTGHLSHSNLSRM